MEQFEYTLEAPARADVTIDATVVGKKALMKRLAEGLGFPAWFGHNWDALSDCLTDFSDWPRDEVVIDHAAPPTLGPRDLRTYLEVLADAVERMAGGVPRLRVVFREGMRYRSTE